MAIALRQDNRRIYFDNAPFSVKDRLKEAGCKWDPAQKGWWMGTARRADAEALVERLNGQSASTGSNDTISRSERVIRGRARYDGKTYYILAHGTSARTGKPYARLAYRDGSKVFWAKDVSKVEVLKLYDEPKSIDSLRAYAERAKSYGTYDCRCRCHNETNAGQPGSTLYDGCDRCGCESC